MLVLSRKESEQIRVGDDIVITVVEIRGNSIRIGMEAPNDVNIVRQELLARQSVLGSLAEPSGLVVGDVTTVSTGDEVSEGTSHD